jgi:hypothetical protein
MRFKNSILAVLALGLLLPSNVQAQTVSTSIPSTLSANLTFGDNGKIQATVNHTVTLPPASINFSYLSFNSQPFHFTTANATGFRTVWRGNISLAQNGTISGTANVDSYTNNGTKTSATVTINATNSRIISSSNNTTINRTNLRSETWGSYKDWDDYNVIAEYPVDVIIAFSNGFSVRGKIIQSFQYIHNLSQAAEDDDYWDNEWVDYNLIIIGPNGHIGTYIQHFD